MPGRYLAVATATEVTKEDFDMPPLVRALAEAGVDARVLSWDDPAAQGQLRGAAGCLIRSTWNYIHQRDRFCAWADDVAASTTLWNPAPIVRWNSHKGYLLELERRGIPIVPTRLVRRGSEADLAGLMGDWGDVVVKPAVGAGSFGTMRVAGRNQLRAGQDHLAGLLRQRDMLVQRYEPSVEGYGERSLVWLDGAFTHAIRKSARFLGDQEQVSRQAMPIAADERALAERVLSLVPDRLLYARVDLVRDPAGQPRLMELELIEPSLFFDQQPGAADRLARALSNLIGQ